nr:Ig domain-containing protein [Comamonas koreensis]
MAEQNGCDASLTEYGIGGNAYSFTSSCTTKTSGLRMGGIISSYSYGSAGAGFDTNGQNDAAFGTGGASWFMGLSGGKIGPGGDQEAQGGFGGGGAGDGWYGGGGGGGYSGGDGGLIAGGAGSFNAGANSTSAISTGSGDGLVSIMLLGIQINVSTLPIGQVGSEYPNTSLSAMGGYAPYNWSATGLPNGMSLSNTGVFSGAPTQYGNFSVEVTVADSSATPLTKTASFPLTIIPPSLTLSTSNLSIATIGTSYTQTIMATGGVAPYSWSATGLPNDLTINQETGTISGIPTTVGSSEVTVSVSDDAGQVKTASFTIVVDPLDLTFVGAGPNITLASGVVSTAYSQPLQVTGGLPPYTFSVVGELPPGLALDSATGVVSGTPTTPGSYTFSVGVADTVGAVGILLKAVHVAEQTFTIVIAAAPVIQGTPTPVPALGSFVLLLLSGAVAGSMGYMRRRKSI